MRWLLEETRWCQSFRYPQSRSDLHHSGPNRGHSRKAFFDANAFPPAGALFQSLLQLLAALLQLFLESLNLLGQLV
jgi:hypothetical protein